MSFYTNVIASCIVSEVREVSYDTSVLAPEMFLSLDNFFLILFEVVFLKAQVILLTEVFLEISTLSILLIKRKD